MQCLTDQQLDALTNEIRERAARKDVPEVFQETWMLDALKRRQVIVDGTGQKIDDLRAQIEADRNIADKAINAVLPSHWDATEKRIMTGGALALIGIAIASRFRSAKETGQAVAEKKGGGWFKKLLIGLGVGALAFAGYKGYEMYKNGTSLLDQFEAAKAMARDLEEKLKNATGDVKENLEKQLEAAKKKIEELKEGVKKEKEEEKEKEKTQPEKEAPPDQAESDLLLLENKLKRRGLLFMYGDELGEAGINTEKSESEKQKVLEFLSDPKVLSIPIAALLAYAERGGQGDCPIPNANDFEKKALYFCALICARHAGEIRDPARETFGTIIDEYAGAARGVARMKEFLGDKSVFDIDPKELAKKALGGPQAINEFMHAGSPILRELHAKHPELKNKHDEFVLFCIGRDERLNVIVDELPKRYDAALEADRTRFYPHYDPLFIAVLATMRDEIKQSQAYIEQYAQNHENVRGMKTADILEQYLNDDLTVVDAVKLYGYLRMARKTEGEILASVKESRGGGAFLLQMHVLGMVSSKDREQGIAFRTALITEAGKSALGASSTIELPENARKILSDFTGTASEYVASKLENVFRDAFLTLEEILNIPSERLTAYIGIGGSAVALRQGRMLWTGWWLKRIRDTDDVGKLALKMNISLEGAQHIKQLAGDLRTKYLDQGWIQKKIMRSLSSSEADAFIAELNAVKARYPRVVEAAIEGTDDVLKTLAQNPLLEELAKKAGTTKDAIINTMKKVRIPPAVIEALVRSKGAMRMLVNACKTQGVGGVEYVVSLAGRALPTMKKLAPGGAVIGLDIAMAAIEINMNNARIAETDNNDLKELYALKNKLSVGKAGVSSTLVLMTPAAMSSVAGATGVGIPLAALLYEIQYVYDTAETSAKESMNKEADWAKLSTEELMAKLDEIAPGSGNGNAYATGMIAEQIYHGVKGDHDEWQEKGEKVREGDNVIKRELITRAYITKMTRLPAAEGELNPDGTPNNKYWDHLLRFKEDQMTYLRANSKGKFPREFFYVYEAAHRYAEVRDGLRTGASVDISVEDRDSDNTASIDLAAFDKLDPAKQNEILLQHKQQKQLLSLVLMNMTQGNQRKALVKQALFDAIRYKLPIAAGKILAFDFSGVDSWVSSGETRAENAAIDNMARKIGALLNQASDILTARTDVAAEDMKEWTIKLESAAEETPNVDVASNVGSDTLEKAQYQGKAPLLDRVEEAADRPEIAKRREAGAVLMKKIGANNNGTYFTKQFGTWVNKYLYMTFDANNGKWLADLGGVNNLRDPASFTANMVGGSASYNNLLQNLAEINALQ